MEFQDFDEVRQAGACALGVSAWRSIDAERVRSFADLTGDRQWIHLDHARAQAEAPFGGAIVHGALILSLVPVFAGEMIRVTNASWVINAGMARARLRHAVPVDAMVRARVRLLAAEPLGEGLLVNLDVAVEVAGRLRAACTAEQTMVFYA